MRHVRLGGTGLRISQLCLGTMTFGLHMSMAQMAIAWVLENPVVTAPIVGASRPEQLDDALAAVDKGLDDLTREYRWGDDIR